MIPIIGAQGVYTEIIKCLVVCNLSFKRQDYA